MLSNPAQGRELTADELSASIAGLPRSHADAVKQRVQTLNRTVRGRTRNRHSRKPDIRDVFRHDADASSTGTRSRSATPDSLDSISGCEHWTNGGSGGGGGGGRGGGTGGVAGDGNGVNGNIQQSIM